MELLEPEEQISSQTCLFRELKTLSDYSKIVLPEFKNGYRRILSLPCSTGEEAYSIALLTKGQGSFSFDVHGIDFNAESIEAAMKAEYSCSLGVWSLLLPYFRHGWVESSSGLSDGVRVRIGQKIKAHTSFSVANALEKRVEGEHDAIFCLHFLYLFRHPETKDIVLQNMLPALKAGGFLLLDPPLRPESFANRQHRKRQVVHNEFLRRLPQRYCLEKIAGTEIYRKE